MIASGRDVRLIGLYQVGGNAWRYLIPSAFDGVSCPTPLRDGGKGAERSPWHHVGLASLARGLKVLPRQAKPLIRLGTVA